MDRTNLRTKDVSDGRVPPGDPRDSFGCEEEQHSSGRAHSPLSEGDGIRLGVHEVRKETVALQMEIYRLAPVLPSFLRPLEQRLVPPLADPAIVYALYPGILGLRIQHNHFHTVDPALQLFCPNCKQPIAASLGHEALRVDLMSRWMRLCWVDRSSQSCVAKSLPRKVPIEFQLKSRTRTLPCRMVDFRILADPSPLRSAVYLP